MRADDGQPHTQHTVGPVPLVYVGPQGDTRTRRAARSGTDGAGADWGCRKPVEMDRTLAGHAPLDGVGFPSALALQLPFATAVGRKLC